MRDVRTLVAGCWLAVGMGLPMSVPVHGQVSSLETLPAWTPGVMDIHHISTGRGNATFFVFPDGTTLLVDSGAAESEMPHASPLPDDSRSPGAWIVRYLESFWPAARPQGAPLDYALVTHFHGDHMGDASDSRPLDASRNYRLSGITEVLTSRGTRTLLDRGWPDYDYPRPATDPRLANYLRFVKAQRENHGMEVERFRPGSRDQIRLRHRPADFPTFSVRNLTANGQYWTGVDSATAERFPPLATLDEQDMPSENMCSLSFRLDYGEFRYYIGGDLTGEPNIGHPSWQNMEEAIAKQVGPVSVHVVNHHGSIDPATPTFLDALRPRVHIVPSWSATHPAPSVLKRILSERAYGGTRDVFMTVFREPTKATIGARANRVRGVGHIVVRVEAGGARFAVWVLDSTSRSYRVDALIEDYTKGARH